HRLGALPRLRHPRRARRRPVRSLGERAAQRGARPALRGRAAEVSAALLRRDASVDVAAVPRLRPRVARAGPGAVGRDGGARAAASRGRAHAPRRAPRDRGALPAARGDALPRPDERRPAVSPGPRLVGRAPHAALHRLLDGAVGARAVEPLALAASGTILAALAYVVRGRPAPGTPAFDWAFGLGVAAVPLVAPIAEEHHLVVLLLPLALLVL